MGSNGFGFPAAIGAQLAYPEKQVICITGDGGFQMNMAEMATAVAWELPIVVLVFNNSFWVWYVSNSNIFVKNIIMVLA